MVNIEEIKGKGFKKKLVACRVPETYIKELERNQVSFTDFVMKALEETFPKLNSSTTLRKKRS